MDDVAVLWPITALEGLSDERLLTTLSAHSLRAIVPLTTY